MENVTEEHPTAMFLRLQNGDDIVAEVVEVTDEEGLMYTVINPLKVLYLNNPGTSSMQIAFLPWVYPRICEQQVFNLNPEDVLLVSMVSEKMNEYYWENLGHYHTLFAKETEEPEETVEEPETEEIEALQEVLEKMNKLRRTYH